MKEITSQLLATMLSLGGLVIAITLAVLWIIMWLIIFKKAGYTYPWLLGVLMSFPLINIIIFLIFVFGEWPISRKLK